MTSANRSPTGTPKLADAPTEAIGLDEHLVEAVATRASRGGSFAPGELLAERFRIVRWIAAGGMGEVYEAEDCDFEFIVSRKDSGLLVFAYSAYCKWTIAAM